MVFQPSCIVCSTPWWVCKGFHLQEEVDWWSWFMWTTPRKLPIHFLGSFCSVMSDCVGFLAWSGITNYSSDFNFSSSIFILFCSWFTPSNDSSSLGVLENNRPLHRAPPSSSACYFPKRPPPRALPYTKPTPWAKANLVQWFLFVTPYCSQGSVIWQTRNCPLLVW